MDFGATSKVDAPVRANGEEDKIIEALEATVARLDAKVSAAQEQLNEMAGA